MSDHQSKQSNHSGPRPPLRPELSRQLWLWAETIKLSHTVFAAPFLMVAVLLAAWPSWPPLTNLAWATLAFVGARSGAMTFNRWLDAELDRGNPRTADRPAAQGLFWPGLLLSLTALSLALLVFAAAQLPAPCLQLSPLLVCWLLFYSAVKRFSWLCHYVLGLALAAAVIGGWLAIRGSWDWLPVSLAAGVTGWVAGFDIIYALQDQQHDQQAGLQSIPARWGSSRAASIALVSHLVAIVCFWLGLGLLPQTAPALHWLLLSGYSLACLLLTSGLLKQHLDLAKQNKSIDQIFFQANARVSVAFGLTILVTCLIAWAWTGPLK